nr:MFS transporter [Microbacterium halimionae]
MVGGRALALAGIVLLAFSLRSAVASLSPIVDEISADIALSPTIVGLIGTAPPVCYAIFGILTPRWERRVGVQSLAVVALVAVTAGMIWRAFATDAVSLVAATALIFAAVGVANVLLPPLVKRYFPDHLGAMTTLFTTTMAVATFVPPIIAVPVADAAGWRASLGLWAAFALAALVPWVVLAIRSRAIIGEENLPVAARRLWSLPLTWALVIAFSASSATAYTMFAWLPLVLTETGGVSAGAAGALLSLFAFMGLPLSLLVPTIVSRTRHGIAVLFVVAIGSALAGVLGLAFLPTIATWLWVALLGLCPLLFPLVLMLLGMRTESPRTAVALSGFVQSAGYTIAAIFPFLFGVIHTATGGWTIPLLTLGVIAIAAIPAAKIIAQSTSVESELRRREP